MEFLDVKFSDSPYAMFCPFDSQPAVMRIALCIRTHNTFGQKNVVHRERLFDALSSNLALHSKLIVHFNK